MLRNIATIFVGMVVCVFLMSAALPVPSSVSNPQNTPLEVFKTMRDGLKAKAAQTTLNNQEAKALKMLDKKVNKWEKKNAKAVEQGKAPKAGKSWLVAFLLCWFLGLLGVHRFYLGYTWQGVVQLLTLGGFGIWTLIDFIRIIIKDLKPNGGDYN